MDVRLTVRTIFIGTDVPSAASISLLIDMVGERKRYDHDGFYENTEMMKDKINTFGNRGERKRECGSGH
jgi:hypothetical protein